MKKIFASCFLLGAAGLLWAVDVHVDKGADPAVKFAAKDLARCLTEVSGQTFQSKESAAAQAGDIVSIAGLEGVDVGDTICQPEFPKALPPLAIDEPTMSMDFMVNDSPFSGKEGKFVTSRHLKNRLEKEAQTNVGLKVEQLEGEGKFKVYGRGELHLTVLIENMRPDAHS